MKYAWVENVGHDYKIEIANLMTLSEQSNEIKFANLI